jgi:hypothetical protein
MSTYRGVYGTLGREEKRTALLAAVESVRKTLVAGADEAAAHATLPQATGQALDDARALCPEAARSPGGTEADLVNQLEVLEAISYIDTSPGLCRFRWTMAGLGF